ncbi:hypothetical protein KI387_019443, partial [Taxus chinensis]
RERENHRENPDFAGPKQRQVKKQEEFTEKDIKPKIATAQPEPCDTQLIIVREDISSSD